VSLYDVRSHHGTRYYDRIKVAARGHRTLRMTYHFSHGGYWQR
jgi:hypothetical protein